MKTYKLILLSLLLLNVFTHSQDLFIPLEFEAAYEEGTRSSDGKPGIEYWQNSADYKINVTLRPDEGLISGSGTITYFNNSPDELDRLVLRLYQNLNKSGSVKDFPFDEKEFTEGVTIRSLVINKKSLSVAGDTNIENTGTNLVIKNLEILPGKQTVINLTWDFVVPKVNTLRMGQYDSTTFFIAYWYPQVAVYDDIDGWDMNEYTGTAEFYNDFNNYDIKITLPSSYGVWATGSLVNPEAVLSPAVLNNFKEAAVSNTVVNIIGLEDYSGDVYPFINSAEMNTWHFKAYNQSDFSFAAAINFLWDGRIANGGPGNSVFVQSAYKPGSLDLYEVCDVASKTIELLSSELPGIPFPLPGITIFNGQDVMEYPMMVNANSSSLRIWMIHDIVHEVSHSYFPFSVGTNERKYAWMDEGFVQMLSEYIQYELDKTIDFRARNVKRYLDYSGQFDEVPMMYPSYLVRGEMYGNHAYFRPANALNILKDFMGDAQFKKALKEYILRWQGKHPTPYDFFFTFEDVTDDELGWFWQPWFFDRGYPDLAVDSVIVTEDELKIGISKEGGLPVPVSLNVKFKDGSSKKAYRSAAVWKNEEEDQIWIEFETDKKPVLIELGNQYIPDADSTNDTWRIK